jgi:hypothetical protein
MVKTPNVSELKGEKRESETLVNEAHEGDCTEFSNNIEEMNHSLRCWTNIAEEELSIWGDDGHLPHVADNLRTIGCPVAFYSDLKFSSSPPLCVASLLMDMNVGNVSVTGH